jgi:site-specific DNA-cytosine methylase
MKRTPIIRAFGVTAFELVIDNFAGGGGASSGIEAAIGRPVDIAINHDPEAIAMHKANHPETKHGERYEISDIGMRMLRPHELFAAQGFPDSYKIDVEYAGKPLTIEAQNRLCGNSVSPMVSRALAGANATERMAA